MKAIRVENISKKYQIGKMISGSLRDYLYSLTLSGKRIEDFWAIKDISFDLDYGEVLGIIGRNGSGKSTLLKILSKITYPSEGRFEMNGRVSSLLEVGTGFHPELSGRENIFLNGTILGMRKREIKEKFEEIIDFSGIEKFIDTPVKRYSSGMYVRLAFSVAAHLDPEILIVDEVLAVGDLEFQKKCLGKMQDVAGKGRTVLFVSHNMGVLQKLCTKAIFLEKGQIKSEGEVSRVIDEYLKTSNADDEYKLRAPSSKPIYYTSVLLESEGRKQNEINFDQSITVKAKIKKKDSFCKNSQLCFALLDKHQDRVFSTIKDISPLFGNQEEEFEVEVVIPANIIVPETYSILMQIYTPPGNIIYDELEGICPFTIHDTGTELSGYSNYGRVILNCDWKIKKKR